MQVIPAEGYKDIMTTTVLPHLEKYRKNGYFNSYGTGNIYYENYWQKSARGVILIAHGFTESAQKYVEMIYYFLQEGYRVYIMDMRGHGRSIRDSEDLSMVHIDRYERYVTDLEYLAENIAMKENPGLPIYLYGHSMGGGVGAALLEKCPDLFEKAVLSSPMLKPKTGNVPFAIAYMVSAVQVWFGQGKKYVVGHHEFRMDEKFESSAATSRERYEYYYQERVNEQLFQTSGASYGWLLEAARLSKYVRKRSNCYKIRTKILLFQAQQDDYVDKKAQKQFAQRVRDVELVPIKETKHEIYMSDDTTMQGYVKRIITFLENK